MLFKSKSWKKEIEYQSKMIEQQNNILRYYTGINFFCK